MSSAIDPLLTTEQAAELLGLRPQTLRNWACTGRHESYLKPRKIGFSIRYRRSDVEAFAAQTTREARASRQRA